MGPAAKLRMLPTERFMLLIGTPFNCTCEMASKAILSMLPTCKMETSNLKLAKLTARKNYRDGMISCRHVAT